MKFLMAISKKTVYLLLLFASGILYYLYSISNNVDGNFYHFGTHFMTGNLTLVQPQLLVKLIDKRNVSDNFGASIEIKINSTSEKSGLVHNESIAAAVKPLKPVSAKGLPTEEKRSVIQHIAPKPDNKSADSIVQGVRTMTLYDSGFSIPSVEICPEFGDDLQVAVIITSAPKHESARMAIRQTWGHYQQRSDVAVAFMIGRTAEEDEPALVKESALYRDIIQGNFVDSYNNLTLKTISMLEWVDNYCHKVKFVLKTDDDMFINIPKLLTFLSKHTKDKRKIFGRLAKKWKPIRNKTSKYYVSPQQFKNSVFPDFTTGPAYVLTSDIIHDLYETALTKTYLKLEDVYTTGIVAQEKKIQRVHVNEFFNRRVSLNACNIQKGISIHMVKGFEQYDLWKKLLDGKSKCS